MSRERISRERKPRQHPLQGPNNRPNRRSVNPSIETDRGQPIHRPEEALDQQPSSQHCQSRTGMTIAVASDVLDDRAAPKIDQTNPSKPSKQ